MTTASKTYQLNKLESKVTPKISQPKKINWGHLTSISAAIVIIIYIIVYGFVQAKGFTFGQFHFSYLVILIPILTIDSLKNFIESFIPGTFFVGKEKTKDITVVIASKNGSTVLKQTIEDLLKRFPPENIIISSNASTDGTTAIAARYGVQFLNFKEPLGKVRAINYALSHVETPYTLIMDDDTLIKNAVLPTEALDEGYEAVAFRVLPIRRGWLSRLQTHEYRKSCDIGKRYHNKRASVQNISGAIGLFKTKELTRQIKLHTGEFSGEDLQRTLLIHLSTQSKGVVLGKSLIYTEVPATIPALFKQRIYGWYPGLYANFFNYAKILVKTQAPIRLRFDAFYNCVLVMMMDIFRFVALPIIIFFPWYFIIMYGIYLILETIPYLIMGSNEPYWIILIYPFYGIFGLITRLIAFGVFCYRRITVHLARRKFLDDFSNCPSWAQAGGYMLTVLLFIMFTASWILYYIYK